MDRRGEAFYFVAPEAKVLLVDDNEMNLKVEQAHIEPLHMQVDVAYNGREALEMMEQKEYDLVYMDQMMPEMDGCTAASMFRKGTDAYHRNLPILCLTANVLPEAREKCQEAGYSDFITKPVKAERMVSATRQWLSEDLIVASETSAVTEYLIEESRLPQIEGISSLEGVENSGSVDHWMSMLSDFHKVIDMKSQVIWDALNAGDWERFTVEVHALKSTARIIGAMELSKEFLKLEELGCAKREDEIKKVAPEVLIHLASFKEILKPYATEDDIQTTRVPKEEMIDTLTELYDAMDGFDLEGADEAMRRFCAYEIDPSLEAQRKHLQALVADVDMEAVMAEAKELMEHIRG